MTALAQGMTDKLEHASSEVERMAHRVDDNGKKVDEIFEGHTAHHATHFLIYISNMNIDNEWICNK